MEAPRSEQEEEDITTQYLLQLASDLPSENAEDIRQALVRCRPRLDGRPEARRLLGAQTLCPQCSMPWWFGRYRAELRPRPHATKPLRRLINKRRAGRPLGRLQTRLLDRFLAARHCVILECKICSHVTSLPIRPRSGRTSDLPRIDQSAAELAEATPTGSGRRRSGKSRDRSAGLFIPASLRTPGTPSTPASAGAVTTGRAATAAAETPSVPPISPLVDVPVSGDAPAATPATIPLKNTSRRLPVTLPRAGRGRGRADAPPAAATPASSRQKQQRLRKILSQAAKSTSATGLMAFLSEV